MDFSTNRLAALAGLASSEVRHEIVREQAEALNESAEARKSEQNESEVRQAVRRTIRKMIAEGNLNLDEFELASDEIAEGADTHMSAPLPEGSHDKDEMEEAHCMEDEMEEEEMMEEMDHPAEMEEEAHDEATLYEMDGDMYMEMHGEQGAMKYMLVPMMDEGGHEGMDEDGHVDMDEAGHETDEGAHDGAGMEEDMDSMQEQKEPEHTIMYKGVKYVQSQ